MQLRTVPVPLRLRDKGDHTSLAGSVGDSWSPAHGDVYVKRKRVCVDLMDGYTDSNGRREERTGGRGKGDRLRLRPMAVAKTDRDCPGETALARRCG